MKAWENCKEPDMLVAAAPDDKVKLYAVGVRMLSTRDFCFLQYREKRKVEGVNVPEKSVQPEKKSMTHDFRRQSGPPPLVQRTGQRNECPNKVDDDLVDVFCYCLCSAPRQPFLSVSYHV